MATPHLIAALGSSFAAGPNIEPIIDPVAQRSGRNYPHQLAFLLGADLIDLSVSGATTANILDTPQQLMSGGKVPPQLKSVRADADIVTVTAGGNDLQFLGAMLYTAWMHHDPNGPISTMLAQEFSDGIPTPSEAAITRTTDGLVRIVNGARSAAPNARVFLVDYLTIIEPKITTAETTPFSGSEITRLLLIQTALAQAFLDAAAQSGAELIRASSISADHALGSPLPWVQPFNSDMKTTAGSFHPNDAGMTAIAQNLAALLRA